MKVKKAISAFLITTILVTMAFSCVVFADDSASFELSSESSAVKIGDEITLTVKGKNVKDLNAYEVNITFDNEKLEYVKAESKIDGYSVIKEKDGNLLIANAKMGNAPAENGDIELCTVTFKGKKTGTANVKMSTVKVLDNILAETKYTVDKTVSIAVTEDGTFIPVTKITVKSETGATRITTRGGTLQMIAIVEPENATNKDVIWSVENITGKATISETGLLKAVANGRVIVRADAADGYGAYGTCEITITGQTPSGAGGGYIPPVQEEDDFTEIEAKPDANGVSEAQFGKKSLKKAIENAKDGIAKLKVTGTEDAIEILINIPSEDLKLALEKGIKRIEVETYHAVFSINPEILVNSTGELASYIKISIKKTDISSLPEKVISVIGNNTVYDLGLSVDDENIGEIEKGDVVVSMNYKLKSGEDPNKVVVYYIDDKGNIEVVINGKYNSRTGKVEFKPTHLGKYAAVYVDVSFSDVSSVKWAHEAIDFLAARGVISGPGDGTFRPNNNVTRAEFIKMLTMAFDLVEKGAKSSFSDVKAGAWYYEPIASAEKLGIVKGKGDGTFGVNEEIIRQDIAVMLYRTARTLGIDLYGDASKITFTDEADISGYAKEAVAAMQKEGIVKGIGDGSFAPKKQATRAEAAVMIYRFLQLVEG